MGSTFRSRTGTGWIGLVCLILLGICVDCKRVIETPIEVDSPVRVDSIPVQIPSWRDSVLLVAESQVGVRELTGRNDGQEVEAYLRSCGLEKGNPWCVALLNWCFLEIGDTLPILHPAYSPEWFQDPVPVVYRKSWQKTDFISLPAQVAGFYISSKGRIGHGGLICGEDQNNYYLIEGNTNVAGSDEGDGVYRTIRDKDNVYVISDPILLIKN